MPDIRPHCLIRFITPQATGTGQAKLLKFTEHKNALKIQIPKPDVSHTEPIWAAAGTYVFPKCSK